MDLKLIAKEMRKLEFKTAYGGKSGHIASAMSITEVLTALYFGGILNYREIEPKWRERDRLIMSKGHGSLALYSALSMAGYFPKELLKTFCQEGSKLGGEPKYGDIPGVEATTGSLGHGLSLGCGMAMALKLDGLCSRIYVILGDGECQEGSVWEAAMSASHQKLNNLTVILDSNKLQAMGTLDDILSLTPLNEKWKSFGWEVQEIDGHNIEEICEVLKKDKESKGKKPRLIIANTIKGKGISFMENVPIWHYRMPNEEELELVLKELELSKEELLG
ncbi:MAG: transketolase [Lachnospiraceae bacterium]